MDPFTARMRRRLFNRMAKEGAIERRPGERRPTQVVKFWSNTGQILVFWSNSTGLTDGQARPCPAFGRRFTSASSCHLTRQPP